MKKTLVIASIACAFASAFSAYADETFPRYKAWFDAVKASGEDGDVTTSSDLGPVGGDWTLGTGDKTWDSAIGFGFDLDDSQYVTFNANQAVAPDTNTITKVALSSYFTPVLCADYSELPADGALASANAQVSFMAVAQTNADQTATLSYRAWTGNGWFELDGATPNDEEDVLATLEVEFDYRDAVPTVKFSIVETNGVETLIPLTTGALEVAKFDISSASVAGKVLNGLMCGGSGNIKSAQGQIAEAIAEIDGKRFISLAEASAAAGSGDVIDVLAETDESITLADGASISNANGKVTGTITAGGSSTVTIDLNAEDINNGVNGTYIVPIKTGGTGKIVVVQPLANKEIADGTTDINPGANITVTIHTKTSELLEMYPDTANPTKALGVDNTTNSPLRVFLDTYCHEQYQAADANAAAIKSAMQDTGVNGLQLWQDYVLGITPDTPVKPLPPVAGDSSYEYITLEIPALVTPSLSGDYTVTYSIYKGGDLIESGLSGGNVRIPVSGSSSDSGTYTVKAVLAPAVTP